MASCILKNKITDFKEALKSQELDMNKLISMESDARTTLFSKFAGENAKTLNTLFEEKIVLKNRLQGLKNWYQKASETGRWDPAKKAEIEQAISEYAAKQQERIFNPKENESALLDLAEKKLGTRVTELQAKTVWEMTNKIDTLKKNFDETSQTWSSPEVATEHGASIRVLEKYKSFLEGNDVKLKVLLKDRFKAFKAEYKDNKAGAVMNLIWDSVREISDLSISTVASFDMSFLGRQGLKTLMTHPEIWLRDMAKPAFRDVWDIMRDKKGKVTEIGAKKFYSDTKDAFLAEIYSNPRYMDGTYELAKLIPKTEEAYPTRLQERAPGVFGRIFKASEQAFTGSAARGRIGLFDKLMEIAKENGVDVKDKYQIQSIGRLINSLTARGQWGKTGEPAIVRVFMWAPRMLKGNIDVLTAHLGQDISPFARKQAAKNLMKIVVETALVMTIANVLKPGSAEGNPTSSDFGKIKVGNTRFDITGGAGSLVVLGFRLAMGVMNKPAYKSSSTGIKTKLSGGFGQSSMGSVIADFLTNKSTPSFRVLLDYLNQQNFKGQKPTLGGELYSSFIPISIQNVISLKNDASASAILGAMVDVFGVNASTYSYETDWSQSTGKEMQQFAQTVGQQRFQEANDSFNQQMKQWLATVKTDARYHTLSETEKQKVVTDKRAEIKDKVLKQYGFKYKAPKAVKVPKF